MNACLLLLGIIVGCSTVQPGPPDHDAWLAEDKLMHFTASFAATAMSYGAARLALDPQPATLTAGAAAGLLGIGKEIADVRAGGAFSIKDVAWDAAGVALGIVLIRQIP